MNSVVVFCTAALGALLFLLGLAVSIMRFRSGTGAGPSEDRNSTLNKLIRAHANTAEFAPFLAVLFLYFGWRGPSVLVVNLIIAVTLCRFLLVIGLVAWPSMGRPNPARFIGALGTYLLGSALCAAMLAGL